MALLSLLGLPHPKPQTTAAPPGLIAATVKAEGRPDTPGVEGPGDRVRGVFQPRAESPLGPKGDAKEATTPSKDGRAAAAKDGKTAAKDGKTAPPLKLTPDSSLPAK